MSRFFFSFSSCFFFRTFYLAHIIIPSCNWVTRILVHTLYWIFYSFYEVNQKFKHFCSFFSIPRHTKRKPSVGANRPRIGVYHVVQTLYSNYKSYIVTGRRNMGKTGNQQTMMLNYKVTQIRRLRKTAETTTLKHIIQMNFIIANR